MAPDANPSSMANRTKAASRASQQVEEQLARYRAMRDFHITAEPSGTAKSKTAKTPDLPFVVQKHAATRLHYDFRLGWNGVLKSWAVTKGPSFFTGDKRLAVEVEDHPIEYAGFEGTIPKGQYGGGTVMIWDFGEWKPLVDVERGLRDGNLKFELHGKKLKGAWALVRMKGRNERPDKPNWLLIKERDQFARAEADLRLLTLQKTVRSRIEPWTRSPRARITSGTAAIGTNTSPHRSELRRRSHPQSPRCRQSRKSKGADMKLPKS